jgi:hypothetical protein
MREVGALVIELVIFPCRHLLAVLLLRKVHRPWWQRGAFPLASRLSALPVADAAPFPRSLLSDQRVRHLTSPLRHRHGYAAAFIVASHPRRPRPGARNWH